MGFEHHSHLTMERRLQFQGRLVALFALAPIVALPFLHNIGVSYLWSYPKLFALQTATFIAWAGLLVVRPARFEDMLRASGIGLPVVALLAWAALSASWSNARWTVAQPLVELCYMALAVVGFANLLSGTKTRRWFTTAYGISAGGACLAYIICYPLSRSHMRVYPFGNPNVAAAFAIVPMAVGAAYALSWAMRRVSARAGVVGGLVAWTCGGAILVSRSTAGMVAAAGALVVVAVLSFRGRTRKLLLEVLCFAAAVLLVWPLLAPGLWPEAWLRRQAGARPAIWQGAARLAREQPMQGLGLGSFFVEYARVHPLDYAAHRQTSSVVENAHCFPVHIVIELGVVGAALAAWVLFRSLRNARNASHRAGHQDRALLRGLTCGGLGMLAQGLVSTSLHQVECTINLVLALALIGGTASVWWQRSVPVRQPSLAFKVVALLFLAGMYVATAGRGLAGQFYMHQGMGQGPVGARIGKLRQSVAVSWPTISALRARIQLARSYEATGHIQEALGQLRVVDSLAPNFGKTKLYEAKLRLRSGEVDEAAAAIIAYCRKNPFDRAAYRIWTAILAEATRVGRPHAARPRQAVGFLSIATERNVRTLRPHEASAMKQPFLNALTP